MKEIDLLLSDRIATIVRAEPGMCNTNVPLAFKLARAELPNQVEYVEGLWRVSGQIVLHAWIETGDSIIDPTLAVTPKSFLHCGKHHYPIDRYSEKEFIKRLDEDGFKIGSKRDLWLTLEDERADQLYKQIDLPGYKK